MLVILTSFITVLSVTVISFSLLVFFFTEIAWRLSECWAPYWFDECPPSNRDPIPINAPCNKQNQHKYYGAFRVGINGGSSSLIAHIHDAILQKQCSSSFATVMSLWVNIPWNIWSPLQILWRPLGWSFWPSLYPVSWIQSSCNCSSITLFSFVPSSLINIVLKFCFVTRLFL